MRAILLIPRDCWTYQHAPDGLSAYVSCPRCGEAIDLYQQHVVASDGEVKPAVTHSCGFSGNLRLCDWNGGNGAAGLARPT